MNKKFITTLIFLILSILSGSLVVLSFPTFYYHELAFFAFVPLIYVINNTSAKKSFLFGLICGLVIYLWGFWWITNSMIQFGGMNLYLAIFCLFVFALYHSLLYAFFSVISKKLIDKGFSQKLVLPFIYTISAFGFPTLFPWSLANSQIENKYFSQAADIVGAIGLNVIILFVNVVIYEVLISLKNKTYKKSVLNALTMLLVVICIHLYGFFRIKQIQKKDSNKNFKVAIIQGNLGVDMLGTRSFTRKSFRVYERLSREYSDYDLIVWPESSVPLSYTGNFEYKTKMDELAKAINSNIIFGSSDTRKVNGKIKGFSTAFLIGPNTEYQVYDKIKLLPFGDYMPFDNIFPFLRKFVVGVGNWVPGKEKKILNVNDVRILPSICYEILIPGLNRAFKKKGADLIVNMTNDTWFGDSKESYQHMGLGRFRAVELRLPIVRSTNTGVSAFITSTGRVVMTLGLFMEGTISWEMNLKKTYSFFAEYGNLFLYLYFLICTSIILLFFMRNKGFKWL